MVIVLGVDGGYDGEGVIEFIIIMDVVMIMVLCTHTYQHQECWSC